jgi:hypothetical protein
MDALTKFDSVQARDLSRAQVRNYDKTFKPIRKGLTALILDICPKPYEIRLLYEYDWRYLNFSMIPPLSMSLGPENITTRRNKWKDALRYYSMRGDLLKLFLRRATGNRKVQANEATLPPSGLVTTYSSFRRWEVGGEAGTHRAGIDEKRHVQAPNSSRLRKVPNNASNWTSGAAGSDLPFVAGPDWHRSPAQATGPPPSASSSSGPARPPATAPKSTRHHHHHKAHAGPDSLARI